MKTVIVALNGPPGSGKTSAYECRPRIKGLCIFKHTFAAPLKHGVNLWELIPPELREDKYHGLEDEQLKREMPGARGVYIVLGEYLKKTFGKTYFCDVVKTTINSDNDWARKHLSRDLIVHFIDDLGYQEELDFLEKEYKDVLYVKLSRPGTTFDGDTRKYLDTPPERTISFENNFLHEDDYAEELWDKILERINE